MSDFYTRLAEDLPPAAAGFPNWMAELRQQGADNLRQYGLPTRKDESWKYTRLGFLDQRKTRLAHSLAAATNATVWPAPVVEINKHIKLQNGSLQSVAGEWPDGVSVWSLQDAMSQNSVNLPSLLKSLPAVHDKHPSANGFSALNNATLDLGVVIHVAEGVDAGRILFQWSVSCPAVSAGEGLLFNTRVCVVLEAGASLQWMEQFESTQAHNNSCNVVVQIELGEGASLRHCRLQQEAETSGLITRTEVNQQSKSKYAYFGFDLGGGLVRHDLHSCLRGENAHASLNGAYLLDNLRHVDNQARVDHYAKNGTSDQYFRGVAGGRSKAVFNTAVHVHPGADGAEASQSNANILLSKLAEINTKPELEIYADEVIANHGATVGQLDEKAVFYMRSRGISEPAARQMLTTAFCQSVSDMLLDRQLAAALSDRMMAVMPALENESESAHEQEHE
jgi:Fe-S cluster assembly protein SufD